MDLTYHDLMSFKSKYDNIDREIIADNIRQLLKDSNTKVYELQTILDISKSSAYEYTKKKGQKIKPSLYNIIVLAAYFKIDPMELLR